MFLAVVVSMILLASVVVVDCDDNSTYIAFSAGLTSNQILSPIQNIAFNDVYYNNGSGYNSQTGVFTAPKAGLYYFTVNGLTSSTKDFVVGFYHNGVYLKSVFARQGKIYASGENSIRLRLKKNDNVYLRSSGTGVLNSRKDDFFQSLVVT